jgi:hypothetical protein
LVGEIEAAATYKRRSWLTAIWGQHAIAELSTRSRDFRAALTGPFPTLKESRHGGATLFADVQAGSLTSCLRHPTRTPPAAPPSAGGSSSALARSIKLHALVLLLQERTRGVPGRRGGS